MKTQKDLIWEMREQLLKKIAEKTGWGSVQLREVIDEVIIKVLSEDKTT